MIIVMYIVSRWFHASGRWSVG